jgi:hyperpolarization activated cyclic nucleotide-gated potassium channel 1
VPLLTPLKVGIHEIIYRKGNHPNAIFFITKGRVSFFVEKKNVAFKDMIQGGYFGDIDIILRRPRQYTVIAVEESDFLTLSR